MLHALIASAFRFSAGDGVTGVTGIVGVVGTPGVTGIVGATAVAGVVVTRISLRTWS